MTETITAWRYWSVVNDGFDFAAKEWDWTLRGNFENWKGPLKEAGTHEIYTSYSSGPVGFHESPAAGCLCGVNAVKRLRSRDLEGLTHHKCVTCRTETVAFAQVDLGGRVDEYEEGYRARQALISGPIYVVNPPDGPGWREAIERRYGQPVIVQDVGEALDWIRKDEEAHGHRQAHQDARAGTAGGAVNRSFTVTVGANTGAFHASIAAAARAAARAQSAGAVRALIADTERRAERAAKRRRARSRLIARLGAAAAIAMVGVYGLAGPLWLAGAHAGIALAWLWLAHKNAEPESGHVTWDELKGWAKEHGAKNDDIARIEITQADGDSFAVEMAGYERDGNGNKYAVGIGSDKAAAKWQSTSILRRLP